jgi:DNA polymerase-3 subunit alpha
VTDQILVVKGRVDHKQEGETKLIAQELQPFDAVPEKKEVRLLVDARKARAGIVRDLAALLRDFPGEAPVFVDMDTNMGRRRLALGPGFRVAPNSDFFAEVRHLLGETAVLQ